jgi:hypothetical protein
MVPAKAASRPVPVRVSMLTRPASKEPSPSGIGATSAMIEARVKAAKQIPKGARVPMAASTIQSVAASSAMIRICSSVVETSSVTSRSRIEGASWIALQNWWPSGR